MITGLSEAFIEYPKRMGDKIFNIFKVTIDHTEDMPNPTYRYLHLPRPNQHQSRPVSLLVKGCSARQLDLAVQYLTALEVR